MLFSDVIFTPYLSGIYGSDAYMVKSILGENGTSSPATASAIFAVLLPWSAETKSLVSRVIHGVSGIFLTAILSICFALLMQGAIGAVLAIFAPVLIIRKLIFGEFYKTNDNY